MAALGEAGLNTSKTVSSGWWRQAKRFVYKDQWINPGSTLANNFRGNMLIAHRTWKLYLVLEVGHQTSDHQILLNFYVLKCSSSNQH